MKITKQKFIEAMKGSAGIITVIANRVGVTRKAIYEYLVKNPDLNELLISERESVLDMAESKLLNKLNAGEDWAIKFYLTTIGRKRGYIDRPDVNIQNVKQDIQVNIVMSEEIKGLLEEYERNTSNS